NCGGRWTEVSMHFSNYCQVRRMTIGMSKEPGLHAPADVADSYVRASPEKDRVQVAQSTSFRELNDRLVGELIDAVKSVLRKEASDRLRDIYLIGDIEKDTARAAIERLREFANDNSRPI